jgi:hypothetical protein
MIAASGKSARHKAISAARMRSRESSKRSSGFNPISEIVSSPSTPDRARIGMIRSRSGQQRLINSSNDRDISLEPESSNNVSMATITA